LDGKLYAGGGFFTAGGVTANSVACWDPARQTWSALGSGMEWGLVHALTVLDGKLYAGGSFSTAGGISAKSIACWNPSTQTWSALGSGLSGGGDYPCVHALMGQGGQLYVGGWFKTAGGGSANSIACWNPATQTWSGVGAGVNGAVTALATLDGTLYVGGGFATAGDHVSACFARWGPVCPLGDLNCDGAVNLDDINPFVTALVSQQVYHTRYPGCAWLNADIDGDGDVNFDDILPFVNCLVAGQCP
jgi:hypothetical protein